MMNGGARLILLALLSLYSAVPAIAQWNPAKQFSYTENQCRNARTALQKDECQYNSESLTSNLRDCIRERSPYAAQCRSMLSQAEGFLRDVNRDPVLLEHRNQQWDAQRRYQQEQVRKGPSGILNAPNPNRNCYQMQDGLWNCN